ncbi:putative mitochondrial protein [Andalucia godoyi]|uniref:Putative mitochondrial protein n=1 Tax=Andalucia godoyi TaxID=505711 RepID=A0A8K0AGU6_ANDGO|nr:putative mitochondrial protein [Andalucia godoyi]|eukprot:ANDGO_06241.mRNA.1 putative mitochondrial protein
MFRRLLVRFAATRPSSSSADKSSKSSSSSSASASASSVNNAETIVMLSPAARAEIVQLHASNPAVNSLTALSQKFGCSVARIQGILAIAKSPFSPVETPLDVAESITNVRFVAKYQERTAKKGGAGAVSDDKERMEKEVAGLKTPGRMYIVGDEDLAAPESAATAVEDQLAAIRGKPLVPYEDQFATALCKNDMTPRVRYRFVDVSPTATQTDRAIWVRESSGSFGPATDAELRDVRRRFASPPMRKTA